MTIGRNNGPSHVLLIFFVHEYFRGVNNMTLAETICKNMVYIHTFWVYSGLISLKVWKGVAKVAHPKLRFMWDLFYGSMPMT